MWKKIEGYEEYSVSDSGDVRNDKTGKILHPNKNSNGYCKVLLHNNGGYKQMDIHRLVAQAFIPNPENKPQVDHINGDKSLNIVSNLRWVTPSENMKNMKKKTCVKRTIYQLDSDDELVGIWDSQTLVSKVLHINATNISRCLHGVYKTAGGYKWSWFHF